jgi:hypothetical protein
LNINCADAVTIEKDPTNGLQVKADGIDSTKISLPAKGSDATGQFVPVMAYGGYTGTGAPKTITAFGAGINIRYVIIMGLTGVGHDWLYFTTKPVTCRAIRFDSADWSVPVDADVTISGNEFTVDGGASTAAHQYNWIAFGGWAD